MEGGEEKKSLNFVEQIVEGDLRQGKNNGRIQTRFPPEPPYRTRKGYLHGLRYRPEVRRCL